MFRSIFLVLLATAAAFAQSPTQSPAASQSASDQLADAEALIVKSDWKSAQTKLDSWLTDHPADPRALFDAGYVADAQNRLDDAVALYRRAIEANPDSFEAQLSLGLLLARQGKTEEARPELAAATKLTPPGGDSEMKARAWRALAQIDKPRAGTAGDTTAASNDLLEALKLSPETPDDTLLAASLADEAGEYDVAEKAYRRVLAEDPKSVDASSGLAHILIVRKRYPEAETLIRAALEKSPDSPALTAQLAAVLADQNKAEAIPLIEKLHEAHPTDAAITRMLAELLAESGDASGSDHYYAGLLAASPNDPGLLIAHGSNLTRQLRFAEAFAAFDKATQLDPANPDGWSGLAFAASKTKQPAITIHALAERSKYLPEVPSTYFLWAISYDSLHQNAEAASYYQHFLDAAAGKFPDQEWQARQRLIVLGKKP